MNWFKFYGQDFLTDMKMSQLSIAERLMWVTMLALAHSENRSGNISYCNESLLKAKLGLLESDREWDEMNGFLDLFEKLDMIEKTDNGVRLINFEKRQQMQFTPAEKQARYREKHKESNESNQAKVTSVTADKNRIDKIRIDKNIKENKTTAVAVLEPTTHNDITFVYDIFKKHFGVSPKAIKAKDGKFDLNAAAAKRLVKVHTRDGLKKTLEFVLGYQGTDKYCRISTCPLEFEKNYTWYKTFFEQKKNKAITGGILR